LICLYRRPSELIIASLGSGGFFFTCLLRLRRAALIDCNCMRKCEDVSELHIGLLGPPMSYGANQVEAFRWEVSMSGRFSRAKSQPTCQSSSPRKSRLRIGQAFTHISPARSIFSSALNFCRSAIAGLYARHDGIARFVRRQAHRYRVRRSADRASGAPCRPHLTQGG
jgi:hypothetical protein